MNVENQQELYLLVMNAPVGICVLDAQTLFAEIVNDSFTQLAGKSRDAILGNYYWDTFPEVRRSYEAAMAGVVAGGEPYSASEAKRTIIRNGKQQTIYISFVYNPLKDSTGQVKKVAVWVMDTTGNGFAGSQ